MLRYYSNAVSQASRGIAFAIIVAGFLLIGFGVLIFALPKLFAFLAAVMFFLAAIGCCTTGVKIYWAQHQVDRYSEEPPQAYRENVRIHGEQHDDV